MRCRSESATQRELASHQDARGLWVHLSIPEWDVKGLALVIAIDPCPVIKPGHGRIVTMKSVTDYEGELVKLKFVGDTQAIEGTATHPLFSEDRGDYVDMGTLAVGERVRTADGWAIVESLARRWSRETVYNIEVDGVHRYLVGEQRVVSHNAGPKKGCGPKDGCADGPCGNTNPNGNAATSQPRRPYAPDAPLPRSGDRANNSVPSSPDPHTQLGTRQGGKGPYVQAREWGANGELIRDIDFTDHGRPRNHVNPHFHPWLLNPTGGSMIRGPGVPFRME